MADFNVYTYDFLPMCHCKHKL